MSLSTVFNSGNLLIATGIIHCSFGFVVPELSQPTWRMLLDVSTIPATTTLVTMDERYKRECAFWFQIGGIFMITQGFLIRDYIQKSRSTAAKHGERSHEEAPVWFGVSFLIISTISCNIMPESGWWFGVAIGLRILWNQHDRSTSKVV